MSTPDRFDSPDGRTYSAPETAGQAHVGRAWDEWYAEDGRDRPLLRGFDESKYDAMRRAFHAGAQAAIAAANTARELAEATGQLGVLRRRLGDFATGLERHHARGGRSAVALAKQNMAREIRAMLDGVPDDGRHPDGCTCQFCREDEREERARADREDDDSMADIIPEDWRGEAMT